MTTEREQQFYEQWNKAPPRLQRALYDFARYPYVHNNQSYIIGFIAGVNADQYWIAVAGQMPADILHLIVKEYEK